MSDQIDAKKRKILIDLLNDVSNRFSYIRDDICVPYGLTSVQSQLIIDIYNNPESKITDLCKRMHKSTNVISPLVNRLIEKGYLIKEKSKSDSRVYFVRITDKSKKIVDDIVQDISDYSLPCFDGITEEQVDLVTLYLKKILEVMNK